MSPLPELQQLPEVERASANIIDYEQLRDWAGYVRGSLNRHPVLVASTFLITTALALAAAKFLPRSYYTETAILAKRNLTINSLVNPDRSANLDPEAPNPMHASETVDSRTKSAAAEVMQRQNLVALVKRVNLLDRWESTRSPLLKMKDQARRMISGPPSEEDRLDAMVGLLQREMAVETSGGQVVIGVTWADPQLAYDLVSAAQRIFFEMREREELGHISDAISILEQHEKTASEKVKVSLGNFDKLFQQIQKERRRAVGDPRALAAETAREQRLNQVRYIVRAKRKAIADEEDQHNRRIAQMQADLMEQRSLYAEDHPSVVELRDKVEALKQGSPVARALREEEQKAMQEYLEGGGAMVPYPDEPLPDPYGLERVLAGLMPAVTEHPQAAVALEELRTDMANHQNMSRRLTTARMERDVAQAAFKHRYTVITPPDFPSRPSKPNAMAIAVGGVVVALLLSLFAALARDVLSGRVLESWQVYRSLGVPVLAELDN